MVYKISLKSQNLFLLNRFTAITKLLLNLVGVCVVYKTPVQIKKFTVLRSPHVNKKAREQFEVRTYSRVLQTTSSSNHLMLSLVKTILLKLPHSILIKINCQNTL